MPTEPKPAPEQGTKPAKPTGDALKQKAAGAETGIAPEQSTPALKDDAAATATLNLFAENIQAMYEFYRLYPEKGFHQGHIVILEFVMRDVSTALALAIRGEKWKPAKDR